MRYLLPLLLLSISPAFADGYPCPDAKPCKVVTINEDELKILTGPNGILPTASAARNLDLGQFVVYFQQKFASAPSGEIKPAASDPPSPDGSGAASKK